MATSGSFTTTAYNSRCLLFEWSQSAQSIADNTTTINWSIKGYGGSGSYYKAQNITLKIDGAIVYQHLMDTNGQINLYHNTLVASGTYVIYHNADGSKEFNAYLEGGIYNWSVNCSGSQQYTLTQIPRQANIISAPNFNDEENPIVYYSNPAGNAVDSLKICITLEGNNDDIIYRDISKTGSSYTFYLTDEERNILRYATTYSNSRIVKFYLKTVIGGNTFYSKVSKTLSIVNCTPILTPIVKDIGGTSIQLTGDGENKVIKGFNVISLSFGSQALKGATITSQKMECGSKSAVSDGIIGNVDSNIFKFTVIDSRGNTNTQTITKTLINYNTLSCKISNSEFLTEGKISFTISGNYWSGNFGAVSNALTVKYMCRQQGTNGTWTAVTPTINTSNGTFSVNVSVSSLDYRKKYEIVAYAEDKAFTYAGNTAKKTPVKVMSCIPVFDWGENDFNFNVPVSINGVELDYIVEQGESSGWFYRKWNSGKAECWKCLTHSTAINTAWGAWYMGTATSRQSYPFPFKEKPTELVSLASGSQAGLIFPMGNGSGVNGTYASACYNIVRPSAVSSSATFYLSFYIYGKWK